MAVHQFPVLRFCVPVFLQPLHTVDNGHAQLQKFRLQSLRQLERPSFRQLPVLLLLLLLLPVQVLQQTVQFL